MRTGQQRIRDVMNRVATNLSVLAFAPEELRTELERRGAQVVVAHSTRSVTSMRQFARETLHVGRFYVFAVRHP